MLELCWAFSNGSHTDQAAYCATTGFPNLPGHESLMVSIEGGQRFDSLASALSMFCSEMIRHFTPRTDRSVAAAFSNKEPAARSMRRIALLPAVSASIPSANN